MPHLDTRKLARFDQPGHRVTGDRTCYTPKTGWQALHAAIDDRSRGGGFGLMPPDESDRNACIHLLAALRCYKRLGVRIGRVMTDNGSAYTSWRFARLLRTVSLDRAFYRPLSAYQYARYAAQVPDDFRFIVKAPSLVCDALVHAEDGRGMAPNPAFLDADLAVREFVQPALEGLSHKVGALVFQLSPLPRTLLNNLPTLIERIGHLLAALPPLAPTAPDGVIALEMRDAAFLSPAHAPLLA